MEIDRIYQFKAVFETKSIRAASELIGMTPGALSKSIKVLETQIGEELFLLKGRNIVPAEYAYEFYERSKNLLKTYEALISKSDEAKEETISIATWEVFSSYFLAEMAQTTLKGYKLRVLERTPHDLEQSVLSGEAEFGITYAPIPHHDLDILKVSTLTYGIYSNNKKFNGLTAKDIPFSVPITQFPTSPTGVKTLDNWPENIERQIKYECELLETSLNLSRRGISVIYCPRFVVKLQNSQSLSKLFEIKVKERFKTAKKNIYLVIRKARSEDKIAKKIAKSIRTICSD